VANRDAALMSNIDTIKHLIKLFEAMKVEEFLTCLTEDAEFRFANYPAAIGREAIGAAVKASLLNQIKGVSLNIENTWEKDGVVICELKIGCTRLDGNVIILPCLDVFRMAGDKIKSMRVYMDASPLG
jgi:ketosteroid isomerase-like protein